ncbi:GNAT family N-acetyltransferase [Streptomyces sp. NPDC056723]|uniref:GNAT family N-acetyltransferase n=1 Tax=unclassified Streptomyces TaxID=2593676 RepID=UPI0036BC5C02
MRVRRQGRSTFSRFDLLEQRHETSWRSLRSISIRPSAGQGLAARLVLAVAPGVRARDKRHFLHASVRHTNDIRLYESPGFRLRHRTAFLVARVPETVRRQ